MQVLLSLSACVLAPRLRSAPCCETLLAMVGLQVMKVHHGCRAVSGPVAQLDGAV